MFKMVKHLYEKYIKSKFKLIVLNNFEDYYLVTKFYNISVSKKDLFKKYKFEYILDIGANLGESYIFATYFLTAALVVSFNELKYFSSL